MSKDDKFVYMQSDESNEYTKEYREMMKSYKGPTDDDVDRMKKIAIAAALIAALVLCFSGCAKKEQPASVQATKTVVDHTGSTITIPANPERVVISSLLPLPSVSLMLIA